MSVSENIHLRSGKYDMYVPKPWAGGRGLVMPRLSRRHISLPPHAHTPRAAASSSAKSPTATSQPPHHRTHATKAHTDQDLSPLITVELPSYRDSSYLMPETPLWQHQASVGHHAAMPAMLVQDQNAHTCIYWTFVQSPIEYNMDTSYVNIVLDKPYVLE